MTCSVCIEPSARLICGLDDGQIVIIPIISTIRSLFLDQSRHSPGSPSPTHYITFINCQFMQYQTRKLVLVIKYLSIKNILSRLKFYFFLSNTNCCHVRRASSRICHQIYLFVPDTRCPLHVIIVCHIYYIYSVALPKSM